MFSNSVSSRKIKSRSDNGNRAPDRRHQIRCGDPVTWQSHGNSNHLFSNRHKLYCRWTYPWAYPFDSYTHRRNSCQTSPWRPQCRPGLFRCRWRGVAENGCRGETKIYTSHTGMRTNKQFDSWIWRLNCAGVGSCWSVPTHEPLGRAIFTSSASGCPNTADSQWHRRCKLTLAGFIVLHLL